MLSVQDEIMVFDGLGLRIWGDVVLSCYHVLGQPHSRIVTPFTVLNISADNMNRTQA